ncbi:gamma-glutamylcyclotransferase family protein [Pseudalkalibacillus sp. SCS-8]|uniref:gamma-glutamylcyclotransferase family protein n=1 Tax=Pseudalkalibacillus nanhaiensis TaxID=3115291 RepID=UPI0032DABED2
MNVVFVYGTLRIGEKNHHLLKNAKRVSDQAWIGGKLFDTGLGYPALSLQQFGKVYGELYEVDDEMLKSLDLLEGYTVGRQDNLYEREVRTITTVKGSCEAYIYTVDHNLSLCKECIPNGDWVKRAETYDDFSIS